jgi:hypothetical protein
VPLVLSAIPRERFSVGDGTRTGRFTIRLTFPGSEIPDQTLEVTTCMTVPTLQRCLADLMGNRHGVSMFVAPSWDQLDHDGFITALYIPGTATPCPALGPGSLVRVLSDTVQGSSSDLGPGSLVGGVLSNTVQGSSSARPSLFFDDANLMRGPKRSREDNDESGSGSDSASPPPARLFPQAPAQISDDEGASGEEDSHPPTVTRRVFRQERAILMKAFKREQRFARRTHRKELRANFDEGIQAGQDRQDADFYPSVTEVEEEAWENYEFDALMIFDGDQSEELVRFRSSLFVIPPPLGGLDPSQVLRREARTNALWEGYRRMYFGELEPEPSHERVMDRLRTEIGDLQRRATRARLAIREDDVVLPPVLPRRDDHDDPDDPPASMHGSLVATIAAQSGSSSGASQSTTSAGIPSRNSSSNTSTRDAQWVLNSVPSPDVSTLSLGPETLSPTCPPVGIARKMVLLSKSILRL